MKYSIASFSTWPGMPLSNSMALKFKFPSPEELTFTGHVNALLMDSGAKVTAYEVQHPDDHCSYHLTFECAGKRKTIHSDTPFHYDPPMAVVQRVHDWIAGVRLTNRWTTDVPKDLED